MIDRRDDSRITERGDEILRLNRQTNFRNVDRMFAVLLVAEWLSAIVLALTFSPLAWAGELSEPHFQVRLALVLGGTIVGLPIALVVLQPGRLLTRSCVSLAQMMMVSLMIHLASGRPEFHFHVFVSLAFLALYQDWRMLVIGGLVVAVDHFFRGLYWPRSVFGVTAYHPWRWVEHTLWAVFEGTILSYGIARSLKTKRAAANREAEIESTRDRVEVLVASRTAELERINGQLQVEILERRTAEDEALRLRKLAEEAAVAKTQFLANMSHEIQTPMNAIIGMTELTLDLEMPALQRENLEIVRNAADSLLVLIDQILDFSKIEANRLDLESIDFSIRDEVEASVKTLLYPANQKGLSLSFDVAPEIPETLKGDPHRLRQILLNLIGNAIKFTARGRIQVASRVEEVHPEAIRVRFSVSDQGIGIPEPRLAMIFDPFIQADSSTTRQFGGTGLGLSISSRLVSLMGGRIWVASEPGQGSTFHFTARFGLHPSTKD